MRVRGWDDRRPPRSSPRSPSCHHQAWCHHGTRRTALPARARVVEGEDGDAVPHREDEGDDALARLLDGDAGGVIVVAGAARRRPSSSSPRAAGSAASASPTRGGPAGPMMTPPLLASSWGSRRGPRQLSLGPIKFVTVLPIIIIPAIILI